MAERLAGPAWRAGEARGRPSGGGAAVELVAGLAAAIERSRPSAR